MSKYALSPLFLRPWSCGGVLAAAARNVKAPSFGHIIPRTYGETKLVAVVDHTADTFKPYPVKEFCTGELDSAIAAVAFKNYLY